MVTMTMQFVSKNILEKTVKRLQYFRVVYQRNEMENHNV